MYVHTYYPASTKVFPLHLHGYVFPACLLNLAAFYKSHYVNLISSVSYFSVSPETSLFMKRITPLSTFRSSEYDFKNLLCNPFAHLL